MSDELLRLADDGNPIHEVIDDDEENDGEEEEVVMLIECPHCDDSQSYDDGPCPYCNGTGWMRARLRFGRPCMQVGCPRCRGLVGTSRPHEL